MELSELVRNKLMRMHNGETLKDGNIAVVKVNGVYGSYFELWLHDGIVEEEVDIDKAVEWLIA